MTARKPHHRRSHTAPAGESSRTRRVSVDTDLPHAGYTGATAASVSAALREVHALNERLIQILVQEARSFQPGTLPLVKLLRELLLRITPESCAWAARRAFILVHLELDDPRTWRRVLLHTARSRAVSDARGAMPRASAIQLARATLMLAWYTVRADRTAATVLFGMHSAVADMIASLSLTQIDRIAEQHFHLARPRWEDHLALWRELLEASQSPNVRRARDLDLRGLQLITAALVMPETQHVPGSRMPH